MSAVQAHTALIDDDGREERISVDHLQIADAYQRELNPQRVKSMSGAAFNPALVGRLIVSRRRDGSMWVVDGQHRLAAMRQSGVGYALCIVYEGWAIEREAWAFHRLNQDRVKPSSYAIHKAAVVHGDPIALDIEAIVTEIGGKLGGRNHPRTGSLEHIGCVDTLRRIYGMRNEHGRYPVERYPKQNGREHLRKTLRLLKNAWGTLPDRPFQADIVKGMAIFLWHAQDDPEFNEESLVKAMLTISTVKLLQVASSHSATMGEPRAVAIAIKGQYNAFAKRHKLGDWIMGELPK